jgi:hypothetical protein
MQMKFRKVHVAYYMRCVEGRQQHPQPPGVVGLNARDTSRFKELHQPLVPEGLHHGGHG